jgi:predicted neutral ceramidase superfamily lipid hydrolase
MSTPLSDRRSQLAPIAFLFALLSVLIILLESRLHQLGVDGRVLHGANLLLFITAGLSSLLLLLQSKKSGGQALLKSIYGGFMIRFFGIALAALIYILLKRKEVNSPGLIGGAIFYVLYWVVEIRSLRQILKSDSGHA